MQLGHYAGSQEYSDVVFRKYITKCCIYVTSVNDNLECLSKVAKHILQILTYI